MKITDDREKGSIQTKAMLFILGIIFGLFLGYFWRMVQEPSWRAMRVQIINEELAERAMKYHGVLWIELHEGEWYFTREGEKINILSGIK